MTILDSGLLFGPPCIVKLMKLVVYAIEGRSGDAHFKGTAQSVTVCPLVCLLEYYAIAQDVIDNRRQAVATRSSVDRDVD